MCDADKFHCKNGPTNDEDDPCIPNDWVNDGVEDCKDGSDETKGLLSIAYTCLKIEQMTCLEIGNWNCNNGTVNLTSIFEKMKFAFNSATSGDVLKLKQKLSEANLTYTLSTIATGEDQVAILE